MLTTLALCRGVQVKDHIHGLSQLQGCAFALQVPARRSDVHCLGEKGAVEEFLRLEQDGQTSLLVHEGDEKMNPLARGGVDNNAKFKGETNTPTLDPHGSSFFQGVKFSVQTISRGRVA